MQINFFKFLNFLRLKHVLVQSMGMNYWHKNANTVGVCTKLSSQNCFSRTSQRPLLLGSTHLPTPCLSQAVLWGAFQLTPFAPWSGQEWVRWSFYWGNLHRLCHCTPAHMHPQMHTNSEAESTHTKNGRVGSLYLLPSISSGSVFKPKFHVYYVILKVSYFYNVS